MVISVSIMTLFVLLMALLCFVLAAMKIRPDITVPIGLAFMTMGLMFTYTKC